jgi:precorrin-6B methylase 2
MQTPKIKMWKMTVQVKISNRFASLENSVIIDIGSGCGSDREVMRISAKVGLGCYELKQHKP